MVGHGLSPPGLRHQQLSKKPLLDRGVDGWIRERHFSSDLVRQRESVSRSDFGLASHGYPGVWRWGLGKGYLGNGRACLRLGGRSGSHAVYSWGNEEVIMVGWF